MVKNLKYQLVIKGKINIGIRGVAELANVSIGTVDRVLHNRDGVSKTTRDRVQKIINDYNYEPNIIARSLASRKRYSIATLIPYHTKDNKFWTGPLEGIEKAAADVADFGLAIDYYFFDQYNEKTFIEEANKLLNADPNGVLIAPIFYNESHSLAAELKAKSIPFVFIDSNIKGLNNISYFGQDSFQSGYLAAKLLSLGSPDNSKFLVIHIAKDTENINHLKQRENGFRTWFKDHKLARDVSVATLFLPGGEKTSEEIILRAINKQNISGVFLTSNAHKVAKFLKKSESDHLHIIGYDLTIDNLKYLRSGTIDFLICQKPREQGYYGILSLLNHLVHNKPVKAINHMPIDIITRENYAYYLEFE